MAKKDIAGLMEGFIGTPKKENPDTSTKTQDTEREDNRLDHATAEAMGITPEMEAKINELRYRKVGRPKGTGRKDKPEETRATFVVNPNTIRKLKFISLNEGRLHKDIIEEALSKYITEWEEKNGVINLKPLD